MTNLLVTAFIYQAERCIKPFEYYLEYSTKLLDLKIQKVAFIDISVINHFHTNEYTIIVPITKDDLHYLEYNSINGVITDNPTKDSADYFRIQLNKVKFMERAIKMLPGYSNYTWLDFGIYHIFEPFQEISMDIANKYYESIRIAGCRWYHPDYSNNNIFWFFCGGILGGPKESIHKLSQYQDSVISELGGLTWEVNIWFRIYQKYPELFDRYPVDTHSFDMIKEY